MPTLATRTGKRLTIFRFEMKGVIMSDAAALWGILVMLGWIAYYLMRIAEALEKMGKK